mgnify:CR=1 FL=1
MIRELKTKAEGEFTDYSSAVLVQDDVQCYRIVLDCNQQLDGASFQVTAKRADGEVIQDMGTVSGSRAEYVVANNMYAVMGEVVFRLTLVGADGSVLTAKELICNVVEANGEADLTGDDRVPALSALIAQASQAAAATDAANQAAQTANAAAEEANEAAQAASSVSSQIGDLDDLATNTKTNLVGAINELADYDVVTVTENDYTFQVTKSNVCVVATNDDAEINSCEIWSPKNGKIITIYNAKWEGSTKDVTICNVFDGEVTIALGEHRTFQCANGHLYDLGKIAAQSIDYGTEDYVRISKPAKRYFVQVPVGNASTSTLQISNLDIGRDKKYYIHACVCSDVTNTIRLEAFDGMKSVWGSVTTDGVITDIFDAGSFGSFSTAYNDIVLLITGVLEPDYMMGYVKCELDITYGDLSLNEIHHRKISSLVDGTVFVRLVINEENCYFLEQSFLEITTV